MEYIKCWKLYKRELLTQPYYRHHHRRLRFPCCSQHIYLYCLLLILSIHGGNSHRIQPAAYLILVAEVLVGIYCVPNLYSKKKEKEEKFCGFYFIIIFVWLKMLFQEHFVFVMVVCSKLHIMLRNLWCIYTLLWMIPKCDLS